MRHLCRRILTYRVVTPCNKSTVATHTQLNNTQTTHLIVGRAGFDGGAGRSGFPDLAWPLDGEMVRSSGVGFVNASTIESYRILSDRLISFCKTQCYMTICLPWYITDLQVTVKSW